MSPTIDFEPGELAGPGYRAVLRRLLDTIDATWQGTLDEVDPEFLHDFRVAVRRTRSILKTAKHVIDEPVRDHHRAEFGWLAGETGRARDLDVYVTEWGSYTKPLPAESRRALSPVLDQVEAERVDAHTRLAATLRSRRYRTLVHDWRRLLDDRSTVRGPDADASLADVASKHIRRAHDRLIERGRAIDDESPGTELHELRKDAKVLRYLIECLGGIYDARERKRFLKQLKALQDNLGEFQDAEVHIAELKSLSEEVTSRGVDASTMLAMDQLTEHLDRRRAAAREEFGERFDNYDSKHTKRALKSLLKSAR